MTNDTRAPTGGFIRELDGLRGLAIGYVMLHRFWPQQGPLARLHAFAELGWVGVDLFFVISGFLIAGILLDTRGDEGYFRNFYARRALRIFPLYYLFVAAVFLTIPFTQGGRYFDTPFLHESGSPLWYLFYLGNYPEIVHGQEPPYLLAPLWSLAIEEQFYLTFPLVVSLLDRRRLVHVLIGALIVTLAFRVATMFLLPANERVQYLATPARLDGLAIGCLLAVTLRARVISARAAGIAAAIGVTLFLAAFAAGGLDRTTWFGRTVGYSLVALVFAALVAWAVLHRGARVTAFLRFRPLTYLGKICYGTYLLHRPADTLVTKILDHFDLSLGGPAHVAVRVTTSIALASASWYALERPLLRLKERFTSDRHPAEATTTSADAAARREPLPQAAAPP